MLWLQGLVTARSQALDAASKLGLMVVTRRAGSLRDRRMFQLNNVVPDFRINTHKNCIENLEKSVLERVFCLKNKAGDFEAPPSPDHWVFNRRLRSFRRIITALARTTVPLTPEEFLSTVESHKRRVYEEAFTSLLEHDLKKKDAEVQVFIKYEKEIFQNKKNVVPRCISPRSYRYLFSDGCYYHAIEKSVMEDIDRVFKEPTVMKGLTVEGVARCIVEKWNSIDDCVAISVDATRFDQHVSVPALKWQHDIQSAYFTGVDKSKYKWLQRMKLENRGVGRTPNGTLKFNIAGRRMSGDMDTGGGNVLLMCAMMFAYFQSLNLPPNCIKLINNGDDCVIFVSRRYLGLINRTLDSWFREMGFNMVCEEPVYDIERIEFCQMQPVCVSGGWRMVRNPFRAIPKDCTSVQRIDIPRVYAKWTRAVADCGIALCGGVPIQQEFYSCIGRSQGPKLPRSGSRRTQQRAARSLPKDQSGLYKWMAEVKHRYSPIESSTRISYFLAFGISPLQQTLMETFFAKSTSRWGEAVVEPLHCPSPFYNLIM